MTSDVGVKRYVRALFEVADRDGTADRVADELDALGSAIATDPEVARVLAGGALPPARKVDAVRTLSSRLGVSTITSKLLVILAERDRLGLLPAFASAFRDRLLDKRNIVNAEVTTATPLPHATADAIARRLGEVTGKRVQVQTRIDPSIIGGVVARVGSTVYDGSVTGQLARMREKLVENV